MNKFHISDHWDAYEVVIEKPRLKLNKYGKLPWSNQGTYERTMLSQPSVNPSHQVQYRSQFFPYASNRINGAIFQGDTWVREVAVKQVTSNDRSEFSLERIRFQARIDAPIQDPGNWLFYSDYYPVEETVNFIREIGRLKEYESLNSNEWLSQLSDKDNIKHKKISLSPPKHNPKFIPKFEPWPKVEEIPTKKGNSAGAIFDMLFSDNTQSYLSNVLGLSPLPFQISSAFFKDPKEMSNFWMMVEKTISQDNSIDQEIKDDWKKGILESNRLWAARAFAEMNDKSTKIPSYDELKHYKLAFVALKAGLIGPLPSYNDHSDLLEFLFQDRDSLSIYDGVEAWKIMLAELGNHETNARSWRSMASTKFSMAGEMKRIKQKDSLD